MKQKTPMNYISMFSGIEAASVAWHNMGWKPLIFSDIDPFATAVLQHRFPDIPNVGDMSKVDWKNWTNYTKGRPHESESRCDLVVGGSPCQAFSTAGLRKSLDDPRGNLTLEFMRGIRDIAPRWFVWENVAGALTAEQNPFGCFLAGLCGYDEPLVPPPLEKGDARTYCGELGDDQALFEEWRGADGIKGLLPQYDRASFTWPRAGFVCRAPGNGEESGLHYSVAWRVLDAQYFGVPQRRVRVFAVGYSGPEWWKPLEVLFERDGLPGDFAPGGKPGEADSDDSEAGIGEAIQLLRGRKFGGGAGTDGGAGERGNERGLMGEHGETLAFNPGLVARKGGHTWEETSPTLTRKGNDNWPAILDQQNENPAICFNPGSMSRLGGHNWEEVAPTLLKQPGDNHPAVLTDPVAEDLVVVPIQDQATRHSGRNGERFIGKGNGLGIGKDGDPMYTMTRGDRHAMLIAERQGEDPCAVDLYNTAVTGDVAATLTKASGSGTSTGPSLMENGRPVMFACPTCDHTWTRMVAGEFAIGQHLPGFECPIHGCTNKDETEGHAGATVVNTDPEVEAIGFNSLRAGEETMKNRYPCIGRKGSPAVLDLSGNPANDDASFNAGMDEQGVMSSCCDLTAIGKVLGTMTRREGCVSDTSHFILVDGQHAQEDPEPQIFENHPNDSRVTGPHVVSPTIVRRAGTGGGNLPILKSGVKYPILRRLTPTETERLQGFPDDWTKVPFGGKGTEKCPDGRRYAACGNSMAVPVMRWIGERIEMTDQLEGSSELPKEYGSSTGAKKLRAFVMGGKN